MFTDFHTHLDFYTDQAKLFKQIEVFNGTIVASSVSLNSYKKNCQISQAAQKFFPRVKIIPTLGIHPQNAAQEEEKLASYTHTLQTSPIIGEIGMDFCWYKQASPQTQEKVFRFFLEHCNQEKKYCVIHTKGAEEKICRILEEYPQAKPIIHWYDGPEEIYREFTARKYLQTFGCQTGRSLFIQKLLRQTPAQLILAETDNPDSEPWLGGKDNSLFLIKRIYEDIAKTLNISVEKATDTINCNSMKVLNNAFYKN